MNSLLKRQVGKHLKNGLNHMDQFFDAIDNSYKNYEDQIAILQRAMKISSDELYEANQKLREETDRLIDVNQHLEFILNSMSLEVQEITENESFNAADYIKQQTIEIVKINRQREELLKNLEKQNHSLNEYAHIVSHDLKSPLRSIHTLITFIREDNDRDFNEKTIKYFTLIQEKVEKMDHLIDGILTYSKIDSVQAFKETIDLNDLVTNITRIIFIPSHIKIVIENELPIIQSDRFRMQQLFQNLISNAVNYNDKPDGIIQVTSEDFENQYVISIKDNGVGIEDENKNKVFQIFQSFNSAAKSTGIGLSIVRKIIENQKEKIWFESSKNSGTTFFFTIQK
jgi:light-regulated signal transduction histidine kinase (bacteriophytochrome)